MKRIMFIGIVLSLVLLGGCQLEEFEGEQINCVTIEDDRDKCDKFQHDEWYSYDCVICSETPEYREKMNLIVEERKECYNEGVNFNRSFDLIKDYNLSCEKIEYINNHFLLSNERKDSGSMSGSYSGFLSHGSISGKYYAWVNTEILATGKLIKFTSFHLDCNNNTKFWKRQELCGNKVFPNEINNCHVRYDYRDTKFVEYYGEDDFIMYYVDNCIQEKGSIREEEKK